MKRPLLAALAFASVLTACAQKNNPAQHDIRAAENMELLLNVYRVANTVYVDTVDSDRMVKDAITSMLSKLDPYTEFFVSSLC